MMIYLMRVHYNGCVYITSNPDPEVVLRRGSTLSYETAEVLKYREGTEDDKYLLSVLFRMTFVEDGETVIDSLGQEARAFNEGMKMFDFFKMDFDYLREVLKLEMSYPSFWHVLKKRSERIRLYHILYKEV